MADVGETTQVSDLKLGVEKAILGCTSFIVSPAAFCSGLVNHSGYTPVVGDGWLDQGWSLLKNEIGSSSTHL